MMGYHSNKTQTNKNKQKIKDAFFLIVMFIKIEKK